MILLVDQTHGAANAGVEVHCHSENLVQEKKHSRKDKTTKEFVFKSQKGWSERAQVLFFAKFDSVLSVTYDQEALSSLCAK